MNNIVEAFLEPEEETLIVNAICEAEAETSGEIRVHIEASSNGNIEARTLEVFSTLNMHKTELRNGVIIYVAVNDREFSIYGDDGINKIVPLDFWDITKDTIQAHFKKGEFANGLIQGILKAGQELKSHFPCSPDDVNELPNTISKG
jgi:uncharacterized membrane protein